MASTYIIYYTIKGEDKDWRVTDYIQALSAQHAVDLARDVLDADEVIEVAKVVKNWR